MGKCKDGKHRWMRGVSEGGYVYCLDCGRRKDIVESLNLWDTETNDSTKPPPSPRAKVER